MPGTVLHLRASSGDVDPGDLAPGRDIVLHIPLRHGKVLAPGVLIDDHLDLSARREVDRQAHAALAAWREQVDDQLLVGGVSISDLWHSELFAEVFLPVLRAVAGVRAAVAVAGADRLHCIGLDRELVGALAVALAPLEVTAEALAAPPRYPGEEAAPPGIAARLPAWRRLTRMALEAAGVPTVAWGRVLVLPYQSTLAVLRRLAVGEGPAPVAHLAFPPPTPGLALRVVRRGGWTGLPGARRRRRAATEAAARLDALAQMPAPALPALATAEILHSRALACLRDRALETAAMVPELQRPITRGRLRAVLLPFDDEPVAKLLIRLAQSAGVPTLSLQHGYEPYKVFHPGSLADHAGVWSEWDRLAFGVERRPRAAVIGNPAKAMLSPPPARRARQRPVAVVLVEHHLRQTGLVDRRITAHHISAAVEGLRAHSADWDIVVRPHPSDDLREFAALAASLPGEAVTVDADSPILELLAGADLCVGAASTATLEAAALGARVVMLNLSGVRWAPPLDGSGTLPYATSAEALVAEVGRAMGAAEVLGSEELRRGLGLEPADPAGAVISWLQELVDQPRRRRSARSASARSSGASQITQ